MELWEALSKRRKEIKMSFADLANETGLSVSTLKKILGGYIAAPSYESVQSISYAMKMSVAELDKMIDGPSATKPGYSDAALRIASIYDNLSEVGKELLDSHADFAEKHFKKI